MGGEHWREEALRWLADEVARARARLAAGGPRDLAPDGYFLRGWLAGLEWVERRWRGPPAAAPEVVVEGPPGVVADGGPRSEELVRAVWALAARAEGLRAGELARAADLDCDPRVFAGRLRRSEYFQKLDSVRWGLSPRGRAWVSEFPASGSITRERTVLAADERDPSREPPTTEKSSRVPDASDAALRGKPDDSAPWAPGEARRRTWRAAVGVVLAALEEGPRDAEFLSLLPGLRALGWGRTEWVEYLLRVGDGSHWEPAGSGKWRLVESEDGPDGAGRRAVRRGENSPRVEI